MASQSIAIVNHAEGQLERRGLACLLWGVGIFTGLLIGGAIVLGAVYAGWNTGLATARADATVTAAAYAQQQCERIPADLAAGRLSLAQSRFQNLASRPKPPDCLPQLAPTASAVFLLAAASPTPAPTYTASASPTAPPATATASEAATLPAGEDALAYDLDALLAEAQSAMSLGDYPAAIDTLDAIISLDQEFQRDLARRLFLEALTAEALALFRSGRLSEAVVMTDRAEEFGNIDQLNHERYIALLYLDGQRYLTTNPAEAVRKFSSLYYEFGLRDYVNGPIVGELQEALRNYGMALALQGDHCQAQAQFEAALNLNPPLSRINLADLTARRDQSILACQAQEQAAAAEDGAPIATPLPVGQTG